MQGNLFAVLSYTDMKILAQHRCFGGTLSIYEHDSTVLACTMRFSLFLPPEAHHQPAPLLTFLSGLTCTHDNFTTKAGAYGHASQAGLAVLAPDTSPRGAQVPDDEAYDLGQGAGFYVNATQPPWKAHYQMERYITEELNTLVCTHFPVLQQKQGITGHSMGGHGALMLGIKYPDRFASLSAFAPIVAPSHAPWGQKAFHAYLGGEKQAWQQYDACALLLAGKNREQYPPILIDQGQDDTFLADQLKPHLFAEACQQKQQRLILRCHEGYDHSYYFIQSFISDHIRHHAQILATL